MALIFQNELKKGEIGTKIMRYNFICLNLKKLISFCMQKTKIYVYISTVMTLSMEGFAPIISKLYTIRHQLGIYF